MAASQPLSKNDLRKTALAARDAMNEIERIEAGLSLTDYAGALDVMAGQIVSGFFPIRSEIDIRPLMFELAARFNVRLCLPIVVDKQTIEFRHLERGGELVPTGFGTYGPGGDAEVLDPDILLIPLAAIDLAGNRIGYGGGFYDRAIEKLHLKGKSPRLIGVAFEAQRVKHIDAEAHDIALHAVLTENGLQLVGSDK